LDPLAAAALLPSTAVSAGVLLPACLLQRLPLRQQALLLEGLRSRCSPAAASAAAAIAQQAFNAACMAPGVSQADSQQRQLLWRYPVLSWALPAAASALLSSIPAAAPELWHQASLGSHPAVFACACTHRSSSALSLCTCCCPVACLPDARRLWA
jgi:hypothetical protein